MFLEVDSLISKLFESLQRYFKNQSLFWLPLQEHAGITGAQGRARESEIPTRFYLV